MTFEDEIANVAQNIQEVKSSLNILQKAIQSPNSDLSLQNIDDNLEVIIDRVDMTHMQIIKMVNNYNEMLSDSKI